MATTCHGLAEFLGRRLSIISLTLLLAQIPDVRGHAKVMLVSFDGFRWDYLDTYANLNLSNFQRFAEEGTRAPYINSTFATFTFPTHYTMATGLYEESHGMISNYMYDPVYEEEFWPSNKDPKWWSQGEPIWITAVKQNRRSGGIYWPGTEAEIDGMHATLWLPFNKSVLFRSRLDAMLDWFLNEDIDVGLVYINEPDAAGHKFGPNSAEVGEKVKEMDEIVGYLMDRLAETGLEDSLNVFIVSDHGMTNQIQEQIVDITEFVNMSLIKSFQENGALCHIFPSDGHLEDIYTALKDRHEHMHVYKREDIPDSWHYKNHRRIGRILVLMDEEWTCTQDMSASWNREKGVHGYFSSHPSMNPIFMARGPQIRRAYEILPFHQVDLYPLLCDMLEITPSAHNGTIDRVKSMLKLPDVIDSGVRESFSILMLSVSLLLFTAKLLPQHN